MLRSFEKSALLSELAAVREQLAAAQAERDAQKSLVLSLGVRVEVQAEMLGRAAEHRCDTAGRVSELERALAPFAAVLAGGWDKGELSADAVYPVRMGDLRQAARALVGTVQARAA